ncbi:hypothetical protein ACFW9D_05695 [Streptomyces sp. NPDC059524]|uniref:hypothetical protein n=1 Tax=Streptomyces sp. NPDC059524 TaxID=3346856 RepID=UPI00369E8728
MPDAPSNPWDELLELVQRASDPSATLALNVGEPNSRATAHVRWQTVLRLALAPNSRLRNALVHDATASFTAELQQHVADFNAQFTPGTNWVALLNSLPPSDVITHDVQRAALQAIQQASRQPGPEAADGVPDELLAAMTDSAQTFASNQPAGLSWEARRNLFLWFWGILVFLILMQAQVQSETAKELLEDAGGAALVAGPVIAGAAYVYNKIQPNPESENDEDEAGTP